jgi:hypothetical protein
VQRPAPVDFALSVDGTERFDADMTGMMEFAGIWKQREQVYAVPAFYVFQMYTL